MTSSPMLYEFCAENFTNVPSAIASGAKRIELCDNLAIGGTTPSAGVIKATVEYAHSHDAKMMCMIRPRGGDFLYSAAELEMMKTDIALALTLGMDGLVFGCLEAAGSKLRVDTNACERLFATMCAAAKSAGVDASRIDVTFHMAFDELDESEQLNAIDQLAELGVSRILTHGGPAGTPIEQNFQRLKALRQHAAGRLIILPGGGITWENAAEVAEATGAQELHGTKIVELA